MLRGSYRGTTGSDPASVARKRLARRLGSLALTAALALPCAAVAAEGNGPFRVGLIPEMNVFEQYERYEALAAYLSGRLDVEVRLTMVSRYGNVMDRLARQELEAAFLGSYTGTLASSVLGMEPIARPIHLDGSSTYAGRLFARRGSGIETVEEMAGKRLALVDRATTAGYLFPMAHFRQHGVADLEEHFSEVRYWGSHDAAARAVLDGEAAVGAAKSTILDRLAALDPRFESDLEVLASSEEVPSNALFVRYSTSPMLKQKLRSLLVGMADDPRAVRVLESLGVRGFETTSASDYLPVRDLATQAGIDMQGDWQARP